MLSTPLKSLVAAGATLGLAATVTATAGTTGLKSRTVNSTAISEALIEFQLDNTPYPYDFPVQQNVTDGSGSFPMEQCNGFTLEEASIDEIQAKLNGGNLTSVQLVLCYLQRNYQLDSYLK
jgi:amidase